MIASENSEVRALANLNDSSTAEGPLPEKLDKLLKFWESKRNGRQFPSKTDFDPLELKPWLGNLEILDVTNEVPPRYRFRLVGTNINNIDGEDITGRYADDVFSEHYDTIVADFDKALLKKGPYYKFNAWVENLKGYQMRYDKLVLPLSKDGSSIDMLLVYLDELETKEFETAPKNT